MEKKIKMDKLVEELRAALESKRKEIESKRKKKWREPITHSLEKWLKEEGQTDLPLGIAITIAGLVSLIKGLIRKEVFLLVVLFLLLCLYIKRRSYA